MNEEWDAARLSREKRAFIDSRLQMRSVNFHVALLFTSTWAAGWLWSWALLKLGMHSMPLRYALSFVVAYVVFIALVRVWADFMRSRERQTNWNGDVPAVDLGEGCLFVVALFGVALLLTGVVAWFGGGALLLEVAFEVVFAGVVVRRAGRRETIGAWAQHLVRRTWLAALVIGLALVVFASWLQSAAPGASTIHEAVRAVWPAGVFR